MLPRIGADFLDIENECVRGLARLARLARRGFYSRRFGHLVRSSVNG
jgi:hypothetical protein